MRDLNLSKFIGQNGDALSKAIEGIASTIAGIGSWIQEEVEEKKALRPIVIAEEYNQAVASLKAMKLEEKDFTAFKNVMTEVKNLSQNSVENK